MRILVIEDEKKVLSFIKKGLEEEGYAVDTASDGETGLYMGLDGIHDLIVLDINLPKKDGLAILKDGNSYHAFDNKIKIKAELKRMPGEKLNTYDDTEFVPGFSDGVISFIKDDQLVYIDLKGTELFEVPLAKQSGVFSEGLCVFTEDEEIGLLTKKGEVVLKPTYQFDYNKDYEYYNWHFSLAELKFGSGLLPVKKNGKETR